MVEGCECVVLVLSCLDEQLVFHALEESVFAVKQAAACQVSVVEDGFQVTSIPLVLEQDLLPLDEELFGPDLGDTRLDVSELEVTTGHLLAQTTAELIAESVVVSGLDDVEGHLDQVVESISVASFGSVHAALVLHRLRRVEQTFPSQAGLLEPRDHFAVLGDQVSELLVCLGARLLIEAFDHASPVAFVLKKLSDELGSLLFDHVVHGQHSVLHGVSLLIRIVEESLT